MVGQLFNGTFSTNRLYHAEEYKLETKSITSKTIQYRQDVKQSAVQSDSS